MESTLPLLSFPNEILLAIAEKLTKIRDCNSLARTNKLLYALVNRQVYRLDLKRHRNLALSWAAETGIEATAYNSFAAGASSDLIRKERPYQADPATMFLQDIPRHPILNNFHFSYRFMTAKTVTGLTPLQLAVGCKQESVAQLLIQQGADVNRAYPDLMNRCTILQLACGHGLVDTVRLLVAAGADIEARDRDRQSAIFYTVKCNAVRSRSEGNRATLYFLLGCGASYTRVDRHRRTPLDHISPERRKEDPMMGSGWTREQKAEDTATEKGMRAILEREIMWRRVADGLEMVERRRKRKWEEDMDEM